MNNPTVTLYSLPLYTSLPVCLLLLLLPSSVWLSLSGFTLRFLLHPRCLFLSSLSCRSLTSFCTGLWERPAMAVLLQGTNDMHELLHCYEFTSGSSSSKTVLRVRACSASPATWQCWTHAPSALWPGLPKEPPQANSTFYHFCPFCTSYWQFVKYCAAEVFEWSHICLEYLFLFRVFWCYSFQFWVKLLLLKSHYHYTGSV